MRIIETIARLLILWLFLIFFFYIFLLIIFFLTGVSVVYGYFFYGYLFFIILPYLFFPLALMTLVFYMFFVKLRCHSLAASLLGAFSIFFIISILIQCFDYGQVSDLLIGINEYHITDRIRVLHILPLFAGFTMYFLGGFLLKRRPFKKGVSRFMKIFFSTLFWVAVFKFYTFLVLCNPIFKEGAVVKAQEDDKKWFDSLIGYIGFYMYMILFSLWQFWLLAWGHYHLVVKKIKNTWMYYPTSILYILTLGAFSMMIELHIFPKDILELWKEHIVSYYILGYVLIAFLWAFLQRWQFKDRSR